ncbi:hypothetical protein ACFPMF_15570 [Larkinella bovis]|uniref:Uncharacterized protein n=1 Tax=Larkinella bovis TaxID=683041 RepID=A0ABW0IB78_9BACT
MLLARSPPTGGWRGTISLFLQVTLLQGQPILAVLLFQLLNFLGLPELQCRLWF